MISHRKNIETRIVKSVYINTRQKDIQDILDNLLEIEEIKIDKGGKKSREIIGEKAQPTLTQKQERESSFTRAH